MMEGGRALTPVVTSGEGRPSTYEYRSGSGFFAVGRWGEVSLVDVGVAIVKQLIVLYQLPNNTLARDWSPPMLTRSRYKALDEARAYDSADWE